MEYLDTINEDQAEGLVLTAEVRIFLKETAKWAKFISIVGFVMTGLIILGALSMLLAIGSFSSAFSPFGSAFSGIFIVVFYIVIAGVTLIPMIFLFSFATRMQTALRNDSIQSLSESFKNLKSHYKFYGITLIIFLCFYGFFFMLAILGGMGSMF